MNNELEKSLKGTVLA